MKSFCFLYKYGNEESKKVAQGFSSLGKMSLLFLASFRFSKDVRWSDFGTCFRVDGFHLSWGCINPDYTCSVAADDVWKTTVFQLLFHSYNNPNHKTAPLLVFMHV